ncbi:O-antigen/teichoic acid export membrane protein [Thiogranum longum]|uniref:O-antigen/teichoic acid export membrane protein n=1 Tax=Thiogranum longum TaxID=1537524 RepID=A0A4V2PH22_9GAMM|nr:oligosaccharide flippase family protein [Thiogranum longum]TCK19046.1 O-antigen/teichoic acid export membrane protein [Thiogranum longum]
MKRRLLVHFSYVTVSRYVAELFFLARGLTVAHILGPSTFGVWSAMRMLNQFSNIANLGASDGMFQRAPYADAAGNPNAAQRFREVASGINVATALIAACTLAAIAAFKHPDAPVSWWLLFAGVVFLTQTYRFNIWLLNSWRMFGLSSIFTIQFAVLSTAAGILGAWQFGLDGFLVALLLSYGITLGTAIALGPPFPRPGWSLATAKELIGTGFPILASGLLMVLLWTTDRLLIWIHLGEKDLGIYTIQSYFTGAMLLIPTAIMSVLRPHLMEALGARTTKTQLVPVMEKGAMLFAQIMWPLVGMAYLIIHLPIRWILPDYAGAIEPGRILMFLTFVTMLGTIPATFLISLGHQKSLLAIRCTSVAVAVFAVTYSLNQGGSYEQIAMATGLGLFTSTALVMAAVFRALKIPGRSRLRYAGWNIGMLVLLAATLALAEWLLPDRPDSWQQDLSSTAGRCAVLLTVATPFLYFIIRKTTTMQLD